MNCLDKALEVFKAFPEETLLYYNGDHIIAVFNRRSTGRIDVNGDAPVFYDELSTAHSYEQIINNWEVQDKDALLNYYVARKHNLKLK